MSVTSKPTHDEVHKQFDPHFFTDYVLFSGTFRHYVAKSMEDQFKLDQNDIHRRFFVIGLYREEFAAYEDMGAIISALIRFRKKELAYPVEGVLRYKPDSVVLAKLFERHKIRSAESLYKALGCNDWIPPDWQVGFPLVDCAKVLLRMCQFIINDCTVNQKKFGITGYNAIKHGLAFVPNGGRYVLDSPTVPAMLIPNPGLGLTPYTLLAVPMDDAALDVRAKLIEFIQSTIRACVSFYLISRYSDFLREKWKISPAWELFNQQPLINVMDFLRQLNDKLQPPSVNTNDIATERPSHDVGAK